VPRISVQGADLSGLEEGDGWIVGGEERKRKGGGVIGTAMTMEQGEKWALERSGGWQTTNILRSSSSSQWHWQTPSATEPGNGSISSL
jgi:hypothetical protein